MLLRSRNMQTTINRLLEILMERPLRTDSEVAKGLGLDLAAVRARLIDLRKRGILTGPAGEGTWTSWFPTLATTIEAAARSGLRVDVPVLVRRSWWKMWGHE